MPPLPALLAQLTKAEKKEKEHQTHLLWLPDGTENQFRGSLLYFYRWYLPNRLPSVIVFLNTAFGSIIGKNSFVDRVLMVMTTWRETEILKSGKSEATLCVCVCARACMRACVCTRVCPKELCCTTLPLRFLMCVGGHEDVTVYTQVHLLDPVWDM